MDVKESKDNGIIVKVVDNDLNYNPWHNTEKKPPFSKFDGGRLMSGSKHNLAPEPAPQKHVSKTPTSSVNPENDFRRLLGQEPIEISITSKRNMVDVKIPSIKEAGAFAEKVTDNPVHRALVEKFFSKSPLTDSRVGGKASFKLKPAGIPSEWLIYMNHLRNAERDTPDYQGLKTLPHKGYWFLKEHVVPNITQDAEVLETINGVIKRNQESYAEETGISIDDQDREGREYYKSTFPDPTRTTTELKKVESEGASNSETSYRDSTREKALEIVRENAPELLDIEGGIETIVAYVGSIDFTDPKLKTMTRKSWEDAVDQVYNNQISRPDLKAYMDLEPSRQTLKDSFRLINMSLRPLTKTQIELYDKIKNRTFQKYQLFMPNGFEHEKEIIRTFVHMYDQNSTTEEQLDNWVFALKMFPQDDFHKKEWLPEARDGAMVKIFPMLIENITSDPDKRSQKRKEANLVVDKFINPDKSLPKLTPEAKELSRRLDEMTPEELMAWMESLAKPKSEENK